MKPDLTRILSETENSDLRAELLSLLRMQASAYTQGDSESLPAEVMLELLASLLYTLGVDPAQPQTLAPLYGKDLRPLYEAGRQALLQKTKHARALILALCREAPPLGCISLGNTVRSILASLDSYDARFFAHRVPGEIDYQLIDPVPESVQGIDYILLYLVRLRAEMRFLSRFAPHRLLALLDGASPCWREEIVSLCVPAGANALGLMLLFEDPRRLHIRESERQALLQLFSPLHPLDIENKLIRACVRLLDLLDLHEAQDAAMLHALCCDLAPRIKAAADAGNLSHVFGGFGLPAEAPWREGSVDADREAARSSLLSCRSRVHVDAQQALQHLYSLSLPPADSPLKREPATPLSETTVLSRITTRRGKTQSSLPPEGGGTAQP